ncbi:MAG TPA: xanthine dehydrogenase family protein subunit M [Burkholderiales bacterium]|nr:xanthine dehydrogenase family protein subunit M [Burkholderiales bacterium]
MNAVERYAAPRALMEALDLLRSGDVTIVAGGTDLMPQAHSGKVRFGSLLMNVRRIPELAGIALEGDTVRIGALTSITALLESPLVRERLPILAEAADHFASEQVRNGATVGGNVCNASPAGDTLVPLMVLDASVELATKPNGAIQTRSLPLREFLAGPGRTTRAPHELLTAVRVPLPPPGFVSRFYKHGTRPGLDISTISIGLGGVKRGDRLENVRVVFGAVAPTPIRGYATERALEGRSLDAATIEAAAEAAHDEVQPISDVRASAWYRQELVRNMVKRVLAHVAFG